MRHADLQEADRHRFGSIGEQVQVDIAVVRRGPREHRAHQARLELRQNPHGVECDAPLFLQGVIMGIAPEQALVRAQRIFYLDVLRQHCDIVYAQTIRCLALRLQEIFNAVLGHDSRGLLRESAA